MGRFLIETHLRTGRPIKELAAAHEVSARWLFKLLRRYRLEGPAGLEPRSRRPQDESRPASPTSTRTRSSRCTRRWPTTGSTPARRPSTTTSPSATARPPSVSTIFRVLKARGFVTLSPQKRPKSSFKRFVRRPAQRDLAGRHDPREFGGGEVYEVLNMIDDHSRLCVASRAMKVVKANDVVRVLHKAAETWGYPGLLPQRQRAHLHHPTPPPGGRGHRTRALRPRHRSQALPALPPTDLRKGRALPPDR